VTVSAFRTVPEIHFGRGAIQQVGEVAHAVGATRVAVVTDRGIVGAGLYGPVQASLEASGFEPALYQEVEPDPPLDIVDDCLGFLRAQGADLVLGLGGGSALDVAKAAAVMHANPGPIRRYAGMNLVPEAGLPTILVPTTAGTGSEVTSIAVLSDPVDQVKVGVVSDHLFARAAVLDPVLTLGLPSHITASTGLDALIHAIESYTGNHATFATEPLALAAIRLIGANLRTACANGSDLAARTGMLQGSLLAGMAFANTQTGGAHACALSLGARFHLPHGVATALMLPAVMRFNAPAVPGKYAQVAEALGAPGDASDAVAAVVRLIRDVGFELGLEHHGVRPEDVPALTEGAMAAARLWANNPRVAGRAEVRGIFEDALGS
jgi:alcohol dehydrogenase class IV